jgi:two-component system CAI-1 autoinducer sensor kinase/phosphatase CqsS
MIAIMDVVSMLKQRAEAVVDRSEPNIPSLGIYIVFWQVASMLIWLNPSYQSYDNIPLRLGLSTLALPLMLFRQLSKAQKTVFPIYFVVFLNLICPYVSFFMTMQSGWASDWAMATLVTIMLIIVITYDWFFIAPMMIAAYGLAALSITLLDGVVNYSHIHSAYLIIYLFGITGCMMVIRWNQSRHESRVALMKSLSGTIAHEMRAPLNAITLAIDAIKTMLPEQREHEGNESVVTIPEAALAGIRDIISQGDVTIRRSNKIIDSILASLNGNAIDRRQFSRHSVRKVIQTAVGTYGFESPQDRRLVNIDIAHDFDFFGDPDLLTHALFNLMSNALYYRSKPGFRIDIFTESGSDDNRIVVRDTGPGVAPDKLEEIFKQFYTSGKSGGNGLGLSFCRRVADSFGGSIICRSAIGEWTEFVFDLPAYESVKVGKIKQELLADKRVLVVDDQAPNRIMLCKYLAEMNCKSDQAENGKIALEMAAKYRYDLILMDIEMPVLNGDEAVRHLRAGADLDPSMALHYREIPIIGVTGLPDKEAKNRTILSGMDSYALKPVGRAKLSEMMDDTFFSVKSHKDDKPLTGVAGASILLVDDNITTREFLKALLEPLGYRILQAENGMMAIDMLRELPIDLIIMDLEMPVMGGIDTAKAIRNDNTSRRSERFREVPIISLSGYTDEKTIAQARESGINLHLGKPTPKHELINAISTLLTRASRHAEESPKATTTGSSLRDELEKVPLLDHAIIESLQGLGDEEFLGQLFNLFVQESGKIIDELEEACRQNDHEKARRSSHTLKGSAASVGAARLQALASKVNDNLRDHGSLEESDWQEYLKQVYGLTTHAFSHYSGVEQ